MKESWAEDLHGNKKANETKLPKVSVLVAVYNAEKYLEKCLDALINQTYRNLQIICVDDCSTDHSVKMLKKYAEADSRIKIVSLEKNQGQAHARNQGLDAADGELTMFCDSDDYIGADAIEKTVDVFLKHPQTDCVLFHVINWYPNTGKKEKYPMPFFEMLTGREAFDRSIDNWKIHGWYMTRTALHKQYPYDETCRWYSDDNTTHVHYFHSREVRCGLGDYYYRQNPESVTHCASISRFDWMKANKSMKNQLRQLGVEETTIEIYENVRWKVLIDSYMYWHRHRAQFNKQEREYGLSEIHKTWKDIETHKIDRKLKRKFGYFPFRHFWLLFRLQEELYFSLKKALGK